MIVRSAESDVDRRGVYWEIGIATLFFWLPAATVAILHFLGVSALQRAWASSGVDLVAIIALPIYFKRSNAVAAKALQDERIARDRFVMWLFFALLTISVPLVGLLRGAMREPLNAFFNVVTAALILYLALRNRVPPIRLGIRKFELYDLILYSALIVFALLLYYCERPLYRWISELRLPRAFLAYPRRHLLPLRWECLIFLASALPEEVFARSYLCTRLRDLGLGRVAVALISAAAFASYHIYQGWAHLIGHFVFGLVFAAAFLRYKRLWPLVLAHATYNVWLYARLPGYLPW